MTQTAGLPRAIIGFHRDDKGDWVADLECGHAQHVRHRPPWQNRPWTETEEGRASFLGKKLLCVKCRDGALADAEAVGAAEARAKIPLAVVERWHAALNNRDAAGVLALSSPEVQIVGPRGTDQGLDVLRSWLQSTRVTLHPLRWFARENAVVVTQRGVWSDVSSGAKVGEGNVASVFRVTSGLVTRYARCDDLAEALDQCGLSEADEIRMDGTGPTDPLK